MDLTSYTSDREDFGKAADARFGNPVKASREAQEVPKSLRSPFEMGSSTSRSTKPMTKNSYGRKTSSITFSTLLSEVDSITSKPKDSMMRKSMAGNNSSSMSDLTEFPSGAARPENKKHRNNAISEESTEGSDPAKDESGDVAKVLAKGFQEPRGARPGTKMWCYLMLWTTGEETWEPVGGRAAQDIRVQCEWFEDSMEEEWKGGPLTTEEINELLRANDEEPEPELIVQAIRKGREARGSGLKVIRG
ncbi:hypothetical protein VTL71DRAFT_4495 [Oculimacula yallundae]|uniref:Chromo domain-containing protein n=1 Tax=Oculimacula yallundae TaxID=86028 RepID=A0ABR4C244_9HELO